MRHRRRSSLPHPLHKRPPHRARARQARLVTNPDTIWLRMAISNATAAHRGSLDFDGRLPRIPCCWQQSFLSFITPPSLFMSVRRDGGMLDPVCISGLECQSSIVVARGTQLGHVFLRRAVVHSTGSTMHKQCNAFPPCDCDIVKYRDGSTLDCTSTVTVTRRLWSPLRDEYRLSYSLSGKCRRHCQ